MTEVVKIDALVADPANVRLHPERNVQATDASLKRFGPARSIVLDGKGVVRAGNRTLESAKAAGVTDVLVIDPAPNQLVAVRRRDWTDTEATAYAIADNRTAELAEWDEPALAEMLESLERDGFPAIDLGFTSEELAEFLEQGLEAGVTDPDDVPEPLDEAITQPGDLWILGEHRLLCGDSSNAGDVDRLLDGASIHLVNTDPPYNVKVEPRSNNAIAAGNSSFGPHETKGHYHGFDEARANAKGREVKGTTKKLRPKDRPLANDFVTDDEFDNLLLAWFGNIARVLIPGGGFYIWGGYANCGNYPPVLKATKLYFSQAIIWVKEHPVLTRKDFMGNHEWCFYGWNEGAAHRYFGPNNATDVWSIKKVNPQSMVHLTEKPVELAVRAIQYSSRPGEHVLDLFGGSGSTLIAAQQTGRRAYLMELDPLYCDVIVQRWEKFTGQKATRVPASGENLDAT